MASYTIDRVCYEGADYARETLFVRRYSPTRSLLCFVRGTGHPHDEPVEALNTVIQGLSALDEQMISEPDYRRRIENSLATIATDLANASQPVPGDFDHYRNASLAMVLLEGDRVDVGWIGECSVRLMRDGRCLQHTSAHTLLSAWKKERLAVDPEQKQWLRSIQTRVLGLAGAQAHGTPEWLAESWKVQPGDRILLCSESIYSLLDDLRLVELCTPDRQFAVGQLQALLSHSGVRNNLLLALIGVDEHYPDG